MRRRAKTQASPYQSRYEDIYGAGTYDADGYGQGTFGEAYSYERDEALARYRSSARAGRRRGKVLRVLGIVALLAVVALAVYLLWPGSITRGPSYVLLMGTDESIERNNDTSENSLEGVYRTDTMILARLDPGQRKTTLVSLPRDTQVQLPGQGTQKLNAAYVFGGARLAVDTVEGLAGVRISHYVLVDMDGLSNVVDALGGIEVDVPIVIDDEDAGGYLEAGRQVLDGQQALVLCRSRNAFEDFGNGDAYRAANQRMVIQAILDKALASDPMTLVSTIVSLGGMVKTDISVGDMARLAQAYAGMDTSTDLYTGVMPTESVYVDELWYELVVTDRWQEMMQRVDAGLPPTEGSLVDDLTGTVMANAGDGVQPGEATPFAQGLQGSISVRNGSGIDGIAASVSQRLEQAGFSVMDTGNAEAFDYYSTVVVYDDYALADTAQAIVDALGEGSAVANDGSYAFESDFLVVVGQDYAY